MTASLKWRPCSRAISCTISTIQASPASEPDVPDEPMINGIPALTARVIMISVSRLTAAAENMQMPVASGPGPGSVLPASQPIIRAPSEIALSSDSARNPEPSMPVAETSGNDAIATLLDCCCGWRIPLAHAVLYNRAAIPYSQHAGCSSRNIYRENVTGARADRAELLRMLDRCRTGRGCC